MKHRRTLLTYGLLVIVILLLAACAQPGPSQVQEVEVTREVEKPVEVTRVVEVEKETAEFPEGTTLHILQWSHFVPQYDKWFDPFAEDWGEKNGIDVTVDHVNIAELTPALSAAIDAGEGPTLIELPLAASLFVEGLQDMTDVNMEAQERFGDPAETCVANSYLPAQDMWYGYCHGWVPDPGDYDRALWESVGMPDGPSTYAELLDGGAKIKEEHGVPLGLGMSPEIDSNMAMRAIIWSFGGSIQDENENVVINSPEVIEAIEYAKQLYEQAMTDEIFSWNAASNNQALIAGEVSYILNSISAYRSLQKIDPEAADNIGFVPALTGPRGDQHASAHLWYIYVIPKYVNEQDTRAAKEFILHHTANYNQATFNSELYNFPTYEGTVPQLFGEDSWLQNDPFGSRPQDKLTVLLTAEDWVTYLGYPGPSNPAVAEIYATNIIPTMMAQAATGEMTAEEAVAEAETQIKEIFNKWRERGYVGGGE